MSFSKASAVAATIGSLVTGSLCWADTAEVMPKGVWSVWAEYYHYFPIDQRYGPNGDPEDLAADYNTALNSRVFPDLARLEAAVGMPSGSASLGDTQVDMKYQFNILELNAAYGLTDQVSLGIKIPYWWFKSDVSAALNSGPGSSATVGLNPLYGTPQDPFKSPFIPLQLGGKPLTTEDIQNILGPGLSINGKPAVKGFGYKPFESWSGNGISDIEVGARYQYFKNEDWRHAFTGAVILPTGRVDDPDNLADYGFGTGAYILRFYSNHDYLGLKDWFFNVTLKYDLVLPEEEELRVISDVNQPLTYNKEEIDRNIGDAVEFDATAAYQLTPAASISARYRYTYKWQDSIDGSQGFNYAALEEDTNAMSQTYEIMFKYSTLPEYIQTKTGIPWSFSFGYRDRFAGENTLKSEFVKMILQVYF